MLCDYRRRRATNNPRPVSKISAVLGSGAGVTAAAVIVIVSTKKSHRFTAAFGVVIVTEVIGCAARELREMLPNALVEELPTMLVNVFIETRVGSKKAL